MEQNKKLSLKEEVEREARKIEEEIENNSDLDDIKVSDKMEESLLAKIRAYEKKCASEHENKNVRMEGAAEELSEELAPNFAARTNEDNVVHLSAEDMEALRLGRELMKKKSKEEELFEVHTEYHKHLNSDNKGKEGKTDKGEKAKRIHMPRRRKFVVALAAVMVLVLAVGMTSVGSKSYWKELISGFLGDQKTQTLNVKDMDTQKTKDGDCSITKAGRGRIYVYASTTANHDVDYISTVIYVDRYNEKDDAWDQIDFWQVTDQNTYFVSTSKSMAVDRGYYYRVHADHFAGMDAEYPYDEATTATDGIWID